MDRSKFLGMDALDGASGVKEPCILEDAMSSLLCEYGELFSASLLTVVAQESLSRSCSNCLCPLAYRDLLHERSYPGSNVT